MELAARERGIPVIATNHVVPENILDFTTLPPLLDKLVLKVAWADAKNTFAMTDAAAGAGRAAGYICAIIAWPKPEHDTCVAPGRSRAKS